MSNESKNTQKSLDEILNEINNILDEILGKLSTKAKPWRELSAEEIAEIQKFGDDAKKIQEIIETLWK